MTLRDGFDAAEIRAAASALQAGEVVAFPTETVYGLGARADSDTAVGRIFETKGRPVDHPLIVHVADATAAQAHAAAWPDVADRLAAAFWPGPLTLIVSRREGVAHAAAAGQPTIGLRCPSHEVARALLAECRTRGMAGIAAPSANRFGRLSATTAAHVLAEFGPALRVLDGGACALGIESAIVDCSRGAPVLLRPGSVPRASLDAAIGAALRMRDASAPRVSGSLPSHYAPLARLRLLDAPALLAAAGQPPALPSLYTSAPTVAIYSRTVAPQAEVGRVWRLMPADAAQAAHELFATLREFDALGVSLILVERPPTDPAWEAIRDRLERAAA